MSGDRYKINDQQGLHFVTFTVVGWLDVFIRRTYKDIIVDSLNYCIEEKGLKVHCWCLMTSHLHLIISSDESNKISDTIRDFKKHTSKLIIKEIEKGIESRKEWLLWYFKREGQKDKRITTYKFWKEDNHAINLYPSEIEIIEQKINYIHQNPALEGVVELAEEYVYSSAKDYSGLKGKVNVVLL